MWEITKFEDEDEDENNKEFEWGGKDGIILLIDCTEPMFEPQDEYTDERPFDLCMQCANSIMKNKIIAGNKDLIGVVFFGTDQMKNPSEFKNIYIFQDLDQPGASRVLQIESMMKVPKTKFSDEYGHSSKFSLSDALWACSSMFSHCDQKLGHKRLLLFTCNDNPHDGNLKLQNQARKRASDLFDVGIEIHLMHIQTSGNNFDYSKFYQDIIQLPDDEASNILPNAAEKLEELLTRVRRKDNKKRPLSNVFFNLGKNVKFSVGVYCLVRPQTKPPPIRLNKANNELVKSNRKYYNPQNGEVPFPSDIKSSQRHGSKLISFEKDEITEMKRIGEPGITLLGFQPRSTLKLHYHLKPAHFIYPNDSVIKGSTRLFGALLKKCIDRNVIAVCWFAQRQSWIPSLAALLPQAEVLDEKKVQITPPGFHVIYLPYVENIRPLTIEQEGSDFTGRPTADENQINKAKEIVKKLQFKFNSEAFDNPALQTHFRNIEALALNQDSLDDIPDYTLPNDEMIKNRAGVLIGEFNDMVFPEQSSSCNTGKKSPKKKPATGTKAVMEINMKEEAKAGRLGKLTVPVLKAFVREVNISCGTKKADLIDAILDHFHVGK